MEKEDFFDGDEASKDEEMQIKTNSFVSYSLELFEFFLYLLSFVTLFLFFVGRCVWVQGDSMDNTLNDKDYVFLSNYFLGKPKYKDIVVLNCVGIPKCDALIVKRVIGVEGDIVDIRNGKVYVNGIELKEDYAVGRTIKRELLKCPLKIPKGFLFYLGDNREFSGDVRDFGILPIDKVVGKVMLRLFPLKRATIF